LANPGVWLGLRVLTPDALGLGLALLGLASAARGSDRTAVALLAAAALTKEQFLLVALGVAIWCLLDRARVRAAVYLIAPAVPLAAWSLVVSARLGGGFDPRNSIDIPGRGILRAIPNWSVNQTDGILAWLTLALVIGTAVALLRSRNRFAVSVGWPWIILAVLSSSAVWEYGNNSMRALAILAPIGALAVWGKDLAAHPAPR
jgi:xanthine/uracil/vitamin C permease (AzgA family)